MLKFIHYLYDSLQALNELVKFPFDMKASENKLTIPSSQDCKET